MSADSYLREMCDYVEEPPVPGETLMLWNCRSCRIGWAAAVKRGTYPLPQLRKRHCARAAEAAEVYFEPWMSESADILRLVIA